MQGEQYRKYFDLMHALKRELAPDKWESVRAHQLRLLNEQERELDLSGMDDVSKESFAVFKRKCQAVMESRARGNADWLMRMIKAYIKAHPLKCNVEARLTIYAYVLFAEYHRYLTEGDVDKVGKAEDLQPYIGLPKSKQVIKLFEECFKSFSEKDAVIASTPNWQAAVLLKKAAPDMIFYDLFVNKPSLLDYEWIDWYRRVEGL